MLNYTLPLSQKVQEKDSDLLKAVDLAKTTIRALMTERKDSEAYFAGIFQTALNIA